MGKDKQLSLSKMNQKYLQTIDSKRNFLKIDIGDSNKYLLLI